MTSTPDQLPWWDDSDNQQQLSVADHQLGKTRVMARKCPTCIFNPGDPMSLGPARLAELISNARTCQGYIICHCSLPHGPYPHIPPAICRGFADAYDTQALQVARRLWGYVEVDPPPPQPPARQVSTPQQAADTPPNPGRKAP